RNPARASNNKTMGRGRFGGGCTELIDMGRGEFEGAQCSLDPMPFFTVNFLEKNEEITPQQ
ncbi:Hypothetical predicted protein, partial [Olea europaea subsp. europaea]